MARNRATKELLELNGRMNNQTAYQNYMPSSGLSTTIDKGTILKPPTGLSARSKSAWNAIVPSLINLQLLNEQDLPTLETMIFSFEEYVKAQKAIKEFDKTFDPLNGNMVKHRRLLNSWLTSSIAEFNKIAGKFGITPTERSRISLAKEEKNDDPLAIVLGEV